MKNMTVRADPLDRDARWLQALLSAGKWLRPLSEQQQAALVERSHLTAKEYLRGRSAEALPSNVDVRAALSELGRFVAAALGPPSLRANKALLRAARGMRYSPDLGTRLTEEVLFALRRSALRFPADGGRAKDGASTRNDAVNDVNTALRVLNRLLALAAETTSGPEPTPASGMSPLRDAAKQGRPELLRLRAWIADAEGLESRRTEHVAARAGGRQAVRHVDPGRSPPQTRENMPFDTMLTSLWFLYSELNQSLPGTSVGGPTQPDRGVARGPFIRFITAFLGLTKAEFPADSLRANPLLADELDLDAGAIRGRVRRLGLTERLRRGRSVTARQLG